MRIIKFGARKILPGILSVKDDLDNMVVINKIGRNKNKKFTGVIS